jgi:hypothetical protein
VRDVSLLTKLKMLYVISPHSSFASLASVHTVQYALRGMGLWAWGAAFEGLDLLTLFSHAPFKHVPVGLFYPTHVAFPTTLPLNDDFKHIPLR